MWQELISDRQCDVSCARCDRQLPTKTHLIVHLKYSHDLRATSCDHYKCPHCDKMYDRTFNLDRHLWLHESADFRCSQCPATFSRPDYLLKHQKNVHHLKVKAPSEHKCKICQKVLKSAAGLSLHYVVHSVPDQHCYCHICQRQLPTLSLFRSHMKKFHSIDKTSTDSNESKNYRCARCGYQLLTKQHLIVHLKWVHDLSKYFHEPTVYTCDLCGKVFIRMDRFNVHLLTHKERNIGCTLCRSKFRNELDLTLHLRRCHHIVENDTEKRTHLCEVCGRTFKSVGTLNFHSVFHKPPRFACDICGTKLFNPSFLRSHMKNVHIRKGKCVAREPKHKCPFCEGSFSTTSLNKHMKRIHPDEVDCGKSTNIERPELVYKRKWKTVGVPYICAICCRSRFRRQWDLIKHVSAHYPSS